MDKNIRTSHLFHQQNVYFIPTLALRQQSPIVAVLLVGLHLSLKYLRFSSTILTRLQSDPDPIPSLLLKVCASVFTTTIAIVVYSAECRPIPKESVIAPMHFSSNLLRQKLLKNIVQSPSSYLSFLSQAEW